MKAEPNSRHFILPDLKNSQGEVVLDATCRVLPARPLSDLAVSIVNLYCVACSEVARTCPRMTFPPSLADTARILPYSHRLCTLSLALQSRIFSHHRPFAVQILYSEWQCNDVMPSFFPSLNQSSGSDALARQQSREAPAALLLRAPFGLRPAGARCSSGLRLQAASLSGVCIC